MPYNSETETFYQAPATVVDSTPDGDTVQEGFDDRLTPAMAGLYADLNLLKADGMISVGIPATTTARGIGRVATSADLVDGATINNGPAFIAAGVDTSVAAAAGKIPVADADGSLNNWAGARYATCATAAATAEKVADLANFLLVKGARVFVTFTNANTVAGALTLNVNSTGAKPIYNELGAVSASNIASFRAGIPLEFIYDGTNWTYKTWEASGNAISQYFYARDEKTAGSTGGSSSSNAWHTRDLNTIKINLIGATLASNRITLPAGRYYIAARMPSYAGASTRGGIFNYPAGSLLISGPSQYCGGGFGINVWNDVEGEITLAAQATIELRTWISEANSWGLGGQTSTSIGLQGVFSEVRIWKM